jgi:NADH dehydrogenase
LAELLEMVLGRDFPELPPGSARIILVEGTARLLGGFHPRLGDYAAEILRTRGVEVRLSTLVREATTGGATLSSGETIPARTIVWSAGVRPTDPLPPGDGVATRSRSGRLVVDEQLRLRPGVYAIGDVASVSPGPDRDGELPMLSPPAMQEGRYVARLIRTGRAAGAQPPFRYRDKGTMATIGRRAAVAQIGPLRLRGFIGWITWLVVHLYYLIGFRNRLAVLASWSWDYLRRDRPIRLIVRSDYDPVVAALLAEQAADR